MYRISLILALGLGACAAASQLPAPAPHNRIAAECAVLTSAVQVMATQGSPAHEGLAEGCPGVTARDIRPLAQQSASLRAANAAELPPGVLAGSRGETVYRRMITRGVPAGVAHELVYSPEFAAATQ